jgi:radical SAM family uncharacterized protein/radical SAM-linked protein
VSLQYELTFTNVLTLLDLGGIPLHAAERGPGDPLVLGGGPTASHPEPMAPFFDAFWIGEAEEELPAFLHAWAAARRAGTPRLEALAELAARHPLYVPALYATEIDPVSELEVVAGPIDPRAPRRVRRGFVRDLDKFPFPSDNPVPYAEAVFDRAAIEIARGCTEGCRFCQAGMLYRPVRERSPDSIVETIVGQVEKGGYDETSLTSLSTADFSCITPLVKTVMGKLRARKVSLGVSSLRAYGLNEDLLDEMASVRATGLTFAPEAGTQRMRDVVNKNVTEAHIKESAERVFRRGWSRLKLYFMIGLPTETEADVRGIVETGARMLAIGKKQLGGEAEVTVSVSSHVPKPHTPFQWAAMDTLEDLDRKQRLLRKVAAATRPQVRLKYHDKGISHVEGVMARGDRRVAAAIEAAWRDGARFDGWDECFDLGRWLRAFAAVGLEPRRYLGTIAVRARLPWDHVDIGLEDGFLLSEYRRALKDRLSPPCGKPVGSLIHHTNLEDAEADARRLVCYDCGVACDMTSMRAERLVALRSLGAEQPVAPTPLADRPRAGKKAPAPRIVQGAGTRYRLRYTKLERASYIGHIDVMRLLARVFRRAQVPVGYTLGYHPKPNMSFGPALALGVPSLGEVFEVRLDGRPEPEALLEALNQVAPEGLRFLAARRVAEPVAGLARHIAAADFVLGAPEGVEVPPLAAAFLARASAPTARGTDARAAVLGLELLDVPAVCRAFAWRERPLLRARLRVSSDGTVKPAELAELLGVPDPDIGRLGLVGLDAAGEYDPLDPPAPPPAPRARPVDPPPVAP